jgi:signal transduction histidine kinase
MLGITRKTGMLIAVMAIAAVFVTCDGKSHSFELRITEVAPHSPFNLFSDIPGVTDEEIAAIEKLQKTYEFFGYGMTLTTEAFINEKGQVKGYAALICEWLTGLFGIRFQPKIYGWSDLLKELNDAELDFAGTLIMSDERKRIYHMTDSIAERQYKIMRLEGSLPLAEIARTRLPRYAFLADAVHSQYVAAVTRPGSYESVWVNDYAEVHDVLERGEADAFIAIGVAEASLVNHDDMHYEDFLPLIFNPVAICTAKSELAPVISVIDKALSAGAIPYIIHLYEDGYQDYLKYKFSIHLSKEEQEYIADRPVVPFVANYNNYPVCFYNSREKEWQGIFFDLMDEVSSLTGLSFNLVNDEHTQWPVIYDKLLNGEAALSASLVRTMERENLFIWSETSLEPDYYALISKSDYRDIMINEIQNAKVGLARNTVYITMFKQWFPDHANTVEYDSLDNAFSALERGEVDMVMATQRRLLLLTHFLELPGYKTNIVFDQPIETILGFNKNEEILCSIINKALKIINTKGISDRWMRMTYDYRVKVAEARLPWLVGAILLSMVILALILSQLYQILNEKKRLAKLVAEQTEEVRNASEAKSRFIANMNHEMRTPMNVIVGITELMLEEAGVSGNIREMLKKISVAGNTLMGIITEVLDISKIEAGRMELMPQQYDVVVMLNDVITLNMIRIENNPVAFKPNIESDLPATLFGDDLRVKQILNNLLSNAFKYTKKGTVTLDVSCRRDGGFVYVYFNVSDTGIGIRKEDIEKLFSDYNQVDNSAHREIEGTGLGLSITKKFVEMMNGEISVESEYGKWTTFQVSIRQGFVSDNTIGKETAENLCAFRYSEKKNDAQKKLVRPDLSYARVLAVDDFPANLDVVAGMLRKYKMRVDCVLSGQEAVGLIAAGEPVYDAIFMDHMMPGMDGIEAVARIRALTGDYAKTIPIIALTANAVSGYEQMFLDNGFNAFLAKPFSVMGLDSVVQKWIIQKRKEK